VNEKNAALYIRVSTDAQVEEGYSIDAQKEMLAAFCKAKQIDSYEFYIDGGWSGKDIERPEMQRLIADCNDKKITHVLIYKLDRISRSQKDTMYLIEDVFLPNNIALVSLNDNLDTSTPQGRSMIGILAAFAQMERENIALRTRMGMLERVKEGYWMGGDRTPFGYDYDEQQGILIPNKNSEIVKKIFSLALEGYSNYRIAEIVGFKYDVLIRNILMRKTYLGLIEYNGNVYRGKHEAIISQKMFDDVNKIKGNGQPFLPSKHLLAGLVYCGVCGAKMRYQAWGKKGKRFVCYSQQTSKKYLIKDANCDNDKPWTDEVEEIILNEIKDYTIPEDKDPDTKEITVLNELRLQYDATSKKIATLYSLYANDPNEILLGVINENKDTLRKLKESIETEEVNGGIQESLDRTGTLIKKTGELLDTVSDETKQRMLRDIIEKVVVTNEVVNVLYKQL